MCVIHSVIWCLKWQLLLLWCRSRCNDEKSAECECMCINIGISPKLIHITWPTWMRIVPCRSYAITGLMWNLDRRRWEKGALASEMEAFIFLFCWSANALNATGKSKVREADLKEEKSFYTRAHSEAYFTLWYCLSSVYCNHHRGYRRPVPFLCDCTFSRRKKTQLVFIEVSHLQAQCSSCIICKESTCVITDKVFHSLRVFIYCCYVTKKVSPERGHCSGLRCQRRQGHS